MFPVIDRASWNVQVLFDPVKEAFAKGRPPDRMVRFLGEPMVWKATVEVPAIKSPDVRAQFPHTLITDPFTFSVPPLIIKAPPLVGLSKLRSALPALVSTVPDISVTFP